MSVSWVAKSTCFTKTEGTDWMVLKALKLDFPRSNAEIKSETEKK